MDINTFLRYNSIALIDPTNEFHASCIDQYNKKGYLSPKQVQSLKQYVYSPADIERLVGTIAETPTSTEIEIEIEDTNKRRAFSDEEVLAIVNTIENHGTIEELHSQLINRTLAAAKGAISFYGGYVRKGKVIGMNEAKFEARCNKKGLIKVDSETPFDE